MGASPTAAVTVCHGHHTGAQLMLKCGVGRWGLKHTSGAGSGAEAEGYEVDPRREEGQWPPQNSLPCSVQREWPAGKALLCAHQFGASVNGSLVIRGKAV